MSSLICGMHHIGINVPDLEAARRFYETVFGFEVIGVDRWDEGNEDINARVGMDESAANSYMLRGANTYLELWNYQVPASTSDPSGRLASDHGYTHVCFTVTDFNQVLDALLKAGGSLIKPLTNAYPVGAKMHYCRDPFGNILEVLQWPERLPEGLAVRIEDLPGVAKEGLFGDPVDEYYLAENGEFKGMRSKSELADIK